MAEPFIHDWRVHPGETLQEAIDDREMSQSALARATGYTQKHINRVVNGHAAISVDLALALEDVLGIDAEFWLRSQMNFDLHEARELRGGRLPRT